MISRSAVAKRKSFPSRFPVVFVGENHFPQLKPGHILALRVARRKASRAVAQDARHTILGCERAVDRLPQLRRVAAGPFVTRHEVRLDFRLSARGRFIVSRQQGEAHRAPVINIDAARLQMLDRRVRFALSGCGNDNRLGKPRRDVQMRIEAGAMADGPVIVRVGHRPRDAGRRVQKRAVDRHGKPQQFAEIPFGTGASCLFHAQLAAQRLDDRDEPLRIDDPVEIRERALADPFHRKVFPRLPRLAQILDGSQRADRGIEEGQQIGDEHIVQKQPAIAVRGFPPHRPQLLFEQPHILRANDLLRHPRGGLPTGLTRTGTRAFFPPLARHPSFVT